MLKALVCACVAFAVFAAFATAAEARTYSLGGMEVIALADTDPNASQPDNPGLLVGIMGTDAAKYLSVPGSMKNSVNCFIVKNGREVILFDTGLGASGLLPASLAAAGIAPDAIDAVVITHFHGDHIGGLIKDGAAAFPRARLMVPRIEVEANPQAAMTFMAAYAGRLHTFEWNQPVADGVVAIDANGHTPGHSAFLIENGNYKLMIAGDLIHFGGIQLPAPDVAVTYDTDTTKAIASRKRLFDKAAGEGYAVAAMHLPYPGIGVLRKDGAGYAFVPLPGGK
jgi:glyoxylase-like metal-dependent hydrolase (beta-lactamase superfamily II)